MSPYLAELFAKGVIGYQRNEVNFERGKIPVPYLPVWMLPTKWRKLIK